MTKVLFVSNLYPPNVVGGYERLCGEVAQAFVVRGHEVTVLTSCYGANVSRHAGQTIHQALQLLTGATIYQPFAGTPVRRDSINRANAAAARHLINVSRPDVIFCWNLFGLDRSLLSVLADSGIPVVLMLTDNWLITMENPGFIVEYFRSVVAKGERSLAQKALPIFKMFLRGKESWRARDARVGAIFGSAFMRDLYRQAGIEFSSSAVVHNGVKLLQPTGAVPMHRSRTVDGHKVRLLFAGRVVDIKGVHLAIEALALLNRDMGAKPGYFLTIVGDAQDLNYLTRLRELAVNLECANDIEFRSAVCEAELWGLFQSHDVYLFPSMYEPFALTLILALGAGIPAIASKVGGNIEIIKDGTTGLLFENGDVAGLARRVVQLAKNPALRTQVSNGGRAAAGQFTFERMVSGMEKFIESTAIKR